MTRMVVEHQRDRDGVPTGCTGVTMEDGTVYRANRAGHIEVDNPSHVAAMLRNSDGFVAEARAIAPKATGSRCSACGFGGFTFHLTAPCPRCGGVMQTESTEHLGDP